MNLARRSEDGPGALLVDAGVELTDEAVAEVLSALSAAADQKGEPLDEREAREAVRGHY